MENKTNIDETNTNPEPVLNTEQQPEKQKKRKLIIIIIIIILAIIGAVIGSVIIYNNYHDHLSSEADNRFRVYFESAGGSFVKPQEINRNGRISKPEDPVKIGYFFEGWEVNGQLYDFNTPVTNDVILTARWKDDGKTPKVTIIFDTNGGSKIEPFNITKNTILNPPLNPTKNGYVFKGWYLNNKLFDFNKLIKKNITLKAKWGKSTTANNSNKNIVNNLNPSKSNPTNTNPGKNSSKFTVYFSDIGGTFTRIVESGKTVSKPANPVIKDPAYPYFHYWADTDNGKPFDFNTPITKDKVLIAIWGNAPIGSTSSTKYTATFIKNGATSIGSNSLSCTATAKSCTVKAPSITRSGFTIRGWDYVPNATNAYIKENDTITLTGNMTYYAITDKEITITFYDGVGVGEGYLYNTCAGGAAKCQSVITKCTIRNSNTSCGVVYPSVATGLRWNEGWSMKGWYMNLTESGGTSAPEGTQFIGDCSVSVSWVSR